MRIVPFVSFVGAGPGEADLITTAVDTLGPITATLKSLGRDAREPALIVERVGFANERVLAGRLGDIAEQARDAQIKAPALFLVGPTVATASAPRTAASRRDARFSWQAPAAAR